MSVKSGARVTRRREPRRPRSPERQGLPRRRPVNDYVHDVEYLDYFDSGRNDYFDYFGYVHDVD